MQASRIAEALNPYIVGYSVPAGIYEQLGAYLDLLLRWNVKTNLTAIRDPESIVRRHFGESLFAAGVLFASKQALPVVSSPAHPELRRGGGEGSAVCAVPEGTRDSCTTADPGLPSRATIVSRDALSTGIESSASDLGANAALAVTHYRQLTTDTFLTLADVGSGAGFPGIPIKLAVPELHVTLIESQNKKATFLKEVIRMLRLDGIEVFHGRAEQRAEQADVVTLRAVERMADAVPAAARLIAPHGRICLLVGGSFADPAVPGVSLGWQPAVQVPGSESAKLLIGRRR